MSLSETYQLTLRKQADLMVNTPSNSVLSNIVETTVRSINEDGAFKAAFGSFIEGFGFSVLLGEADGDLTQNVRLSFEDVHGAYYANSSDIQKTADVLSHQVIEKLACQNVQVKLNNAANSSLSIRLT